MKLRSAFTYFYNTLTGTPVSAPDDFVQVKNNDVCAEALSNNAAYGKTGDFIETGSHKVKASDKKGIYLAAFNNNFKELSKLLNEEQKLRLMMTIAGASCVEEMLNSKETTLNKIIYYLKEAEKDMGDTPIKTQDDISKLVQKANSYYLAVEYGHFESVEEFRNACEKADSADIKELNDDPEKYFEKYYGKGKNIFRKIGHSISAAWHGQSKEEYSSEKMMQEVSIALLNAKTYEDKAGLVCVVKKLYQGNSEHENDRIALFKMIYCSMTPEEQERFSHEFVDIKNLITVVGPDANSVTIRKTEACAAAHMNEEDAVQHNENINNTVNSIEARINELKQKENLTEAEQSELQKLQEELNGIYTPVLAGNTEGSFDNYNIDQETAVEFATNNSSHSNAGDVLALIAEDIANGYEFSRYTNEEVTQMLNEATNDWYSSVEQAILNGEPIPERPETPFVQTLNNTSNNTGTTASNSSNQNTSLTTDTDTTQTSPAYYTQSGSNDSTFNFNAGSSVVTNPFASAYSGTTISANTGNYSKTSNETSAKTDTAVAYDKIQTVEQYKDAGQKDGRLFAISAFFSNNTQKGSAAWNEALADYQQAGLKDQVNILSNCNKKGFDTLIEYSSLSTLAEFENSGLTGPDFDSTQKLHNKIKELKEKENKKNENPVNVS